MTQDKIRKTIVRARMAATGEPYAEAARRVAEQHDPVTGAFGGPLARVRVVVSLLFLDESGSVLLVRRPAAPGWELPGRYLRPHETPATVSVEMVPEQLGISPRIGRMLVVDWAPDPDDGFPEADKAVFVFDGGQLTAENIRAIRLDPVQLAEYAFHAPESPLLPRWSTALGRRVGAALAARGGHPDRYLELGIGGR